MGGPSDVSCSQHEIDDKCINIFVLNPEGKSLLGKIKCSWEENVKTDLTFVGPCIAIIFPEYNQQDATLRNFIYFCKMLDMFQAVPPPIIRNTKLYIQLQVFVKP